MIYITQAFHENEPLTIERVVALMQGHNGSATYVTDDRGNRFLAFRKRVYPIRECIECGTLIIGETAKYCTKCLDGVLNADEAYYSTESCTLMLEYFLREHLRRSAENEDRDALRSLTQWADEITERGGDDVKQVYERKRTWASR